VIAPAHPYRTPGPRAATPWHLHADALRAAERLANQFVLGWAILRVGVCAFEGLDIEGVVALVIVVTAVASLARSFS